MYFKRLAAEAQKQATNLSSRASVALDRGLNREGSTSGEPFTSAWDLPWSMVRCLYMSGIWLCSQKVGLHDICPAGACLRLGLLCL